ncbi:MAG: hypothetical protein DI596_11840 [Azospira oryzae]|nr:MAG: hypothetical protein DI596_11840 [Azospira oryzae]PZP77737.1 MAG: hypothetical protein DI593_11840 [Azospira oryzae]
MRYDAGEDAVFPDFRLLDAGRECPMEVFGLGSAEYLRRKKKKVAYYDARYGRDGWWRWEATENPREGAVPPFPEKAKRYRL